MTRIDRSALVPYTCAQMFSLVDDIKSYPEFLLWCHSATVLSRTEDQVEARIEISHRGLHKSFTTRNTLQSDTCIEMQLVEGPFKHLYGVWHFDKLNGAGKSSGCKISLHMEFEFSNRLIGMAIGPLFSQIATSLVDSFGIRAKDLYG